MPVVPKKVNELDGVPDLANTKLFAVVDPATGKMYKSTLGQIKGIHREKIILNNDGPYNLPAGTLISKIVVYLNGTINLKIGNSAGTDEVLQAYQIIDEDVLSIDIFAQTQRNIYFSGITGNGPVTLIFIKSIE